MVFFSVYFVIWFRVLHSKLLPPNYFNGGSIEVILKFHHFIEGPSVGHSTSILSREWALDSMFFSPTQRVYWRLNFLHFNFHNPPQSTWILGAKLNSPSTWFKGIRRLTISEMICLEKCVFCCGGAIFLGHPQVCQLTSTLKWWSLVGYHLHDAIRVSVSSSGRYPCH